MANIHNNYIDGKWIPSSGGDTYEQRSPADLAEVTGVWQKSTTDDARQAVEAARRAFESWSGLSVYQRAEYLNAALELMIERADAIAKVITAENGKTIPESRSEIASAVREMEFQIYQGVRTGGEVMPSSMSGVLAYTIRRPLGAVAVIAPWNFPFNVPARKITPALISGNTCVLKPAQLTPGAGEQFVRLFEDAGVPAGVINLITGSGSVIGAELVTNPAIRAITFTGSTEVGRSINAKAATGMKRTQLEMGGKNPLVVLTDADLPAAAAATALAAFACAGQWCTSTSRAIVQRPVLDEFIDLLLGHVRKIVVGKGDDKASTMGPVCGQTQLDGILAAIEKGKAQGATLLVGGGRITEGDLAKGCFVEPTVFTDVTADMSVAQDEIFGPVLSVMTVDDFDEAVDLANAVEFGLASSVYTADLEKAMEFVGRTDVGLTHVNMPTAYKEPQLSFGGVKASGHGIPEAGPTGIEFFTEHKTVYIRTGV